MSQPKSPSKNKQTLIILAGVVTAMICMAFASVPLYRLFCQKTGYGGTTQVAVASSHVDRSRVIRVQFNADVNPKLPWRFQPSQHEIKVFAGQEALAFYQSENLTDQPITGMATYNVTPEKAGVYFTKIDCFCFIEQTLEPHQIVDMPVLFYIDPEIVKDPKLNDVTTITLSYTFFRIK